MIILFWILGDLFQVVFIRDHYNGVDSFGGQTYGLGFCCHVLCCVLLHLELGQSHLWRELLAQLHQLDIWV